MIRRSLRIGIRLGLLSGLAFVLFKIVQARRTAPDLSGSDDGWPQAPLPPSGGPVARSVDVETAVAPGPAEPFAMVPAADDTGTAPEAPPAPVEAPRASVEEAPAPVETASPRETARPAKERPAKASPAKAVGPSPAAEAAARAAAESAAKKAVAKAVATKSVAKSGAAKSGAAKKVAAKAGAAKSGVAKATAKAAAKVVGPAKKARTVPAPAEPAPGAAWVPAQEGACPASHPIKAKLASRIFHLPGMAAYQRTAADRCYADEASAEADGLRKAKR